MSASITDTTPDRWCEDAELLALDPDYAELIAEIESVFAGITAPPRPPARPGDGEPHRYRPRGRTRAYPPPTRPTASRRAPNQRSPPLRRRSGATPIPHGSRSEVMRNRQIPDIDSSTELKTFSLRSRWPGHRPATDSIPQQPVSSRVT